jgi:hypothetical protein
MQPSMHLFFAGPVRLESAVAQRTYLILIILSLTEGGFYSAATFLCLTNKLLKAEKLTLSPVWYKIRVALQTCDTCRIDIPSNKTNQYNYGQKVKRYPLI